VTNPLMEDERVAEKVAAVEVESSAPKMTNGGAGRDLPSANSNSPNRPSSILKIKGSEIQTKPAPRLFRRSPAR